MANTCNEAKSLETLDHFSNHPTVNYHINNVGPVAANPEGNTGHYSVSCGSLEGYSPHPHHSLEKSSFDNGHNLGSTTQDCFTNHEVEAFRSENWSLSNTQMLTNGDSQWTPETEEEEIGLQLPGGFKDQSSQDGDVNNGSLQRKAQRNISKPFIQRYVHACYYIL